MLHYDLGVVTHDYAYMEQYGLGQRRLLHQRRGGYRTRFNGNIVRAGLNYHVNWNPPAPLDARC